MCRWSRELAAGNNEIYLPNPRQINSELQNEKSMLCKFRWSDDCKSDQIRWSTNLTFWRNTIPQIPRLGICISPRSSQLKYIDPMRRPNETDWSAARSSVDSKKTVMMETIWFDLNMHKHYSSQVTEFRKGLDLFRLYSLWSLILVSCSNMSMRPFWNMRLQEQSHAR